MENRQEDLMSNSNNYGRVTGPLKAKIKNLADTSELSNVKEKLMKKGKDEVSELFNSDSVTFVKENWKMIAGGVALVGVAVAGIAALSLKASAVDTIKKQGEKNA